MAILRSKEISEMSSEDLDKHLYELRKDLMKINGVLASGGVPEDVGKVREIKRTIARILTYKKILEKKPKKEENKSTKEKKDIAEEKKTEKIKKISEV